ncbi:MAG: ATP phosphoribosyltransferase [Gammaproteobacteria bacterium]|nr:ATP phosphoribosyltransferase [Gammaproteobacteria bacterium]MBS9778655.1 ATP phosphoribosyltransferase [Gammaproteobacteria bacterium]
MLKMVIPKGKLFNKVEDILYETGIKITGNSRDYRPTCSDKQIEVKLLKSQNIPELVALGQHDVGFAGQDWIDEQQADVEVLMDLGFNPVNIVACIPESSDLTQLTKKPIIVASEYKNLAKNYLDSLNIDYRLFRAYGATEVLPPEDADMIIDNTSTGATITANRLKIVDTLMSSSTKFIANKEALQDPIKKQKIDNLLLLMRGVMAGRERVLLEMNCVEETLNQVIAVLPCMRSPTINKLYKSDEYSIRSAVLTDEVSEIIPQLISAGATDILEIPIRKVL